MPVITEYQPATQTPTLTNSERPLPVSRQVQRLPFPNPLATLFFLSGASSLILETLFTRLLSYTFGNTAYAASTVLAAFLGGLSLGSYLIGRWVDRWRPSILIYGTLELAIGIYALLVPLLFAGLTRSYVFLFHLLNLEQTGATAIRFLLASFVVIIPSAFMGGTLPALARLVAATRAEHQAELSKLYAFNTFGAAAGTLISTYFLMPTWGIYGTLVTAFSMNAAIFCSTLWLRKGHRSFSKAELSVARDAQNTEMAMMTESTSWMINGRVRFFLMMAALLTGVITLAYEVIWTHALAFLVGNAVYAFGMMLFTFLCGLAAGAHLVSRLPKKPTTWSRAFVVSQVLTGMVVLLTLPLWNRVPDLFLLGANGGAFQPAFEWDLRLVCLLILLRMAYLAVTGVRRRLKELTAESLLLVLLLTRTVPELPGVWAYFAVTELFRFFVAFGLLIVPATLMGVAFPALLNLLNSARDRAGRTVGSVYAGNTIGCILGSLLAGFFLLERLGSYNLLRTAAASNVCLGVAFFLIVIGSTSRLQKLAAVGIVTALLAAAGLLLPGWNIRSLTRGTYVYFDHPWIADQVHYAREDVQGGLTTVIESNLGRTLLTNGKFQGNNSVEVAAQVRFALIPSLFTHEYDRALVIGLGTGNSLRTLSALPFRRLDVVELSPAIVAAAHDWFGDVNGGVLDRDPRVHVSINDGRNHLLVSRDRYNLITIEVSSIWISGEGDLYNAEFYQLCKSHLTQQGVLQQWVQIHHMRPRDFFVILNTAAHVFPHVAFFLGPAQGLLIASSSPLELDYQQLRALDSTPAIRHELDTIHTRSMFSLVGEVIVYDDGYRDRVAALARQTGMPQDTISTDMRPYLEYQTPKGNVLPFDFLIDPWFFIRFKEPTLPPKLSIGNLPEPDDRAYALGLAYEGREDFAAAINQFKQVQGTKRSCAQAEITWLEGRQAQRQGSPTVPAPPLCE